MENLKQAIASIELDAQHKVIPPEDPNDASWKRLVKKHPELHKVPMKPSTKHPAKGVTMKSLSEIAKRIVSADGESRRIWVTDLAAYNNGIQNGAWIDVTTVDEIQNKIDEVLKKSPVPGAEEWSIFDYDGFGEMTTKLGENPSLETVVALSDLMNDYNPAVVEYAYNEVPDGDGVEEYREFLDEHYVGEFNSEEDWAEAYLSETGVIDEVPETLRYYIDYESYARDSNYNGVVNFVEDSKTGKVIAFYG